MEHEDDYETPRDFESRDDDYRTPGDPGECEDRGGEHAGGDHTGAGGEHTGAGGEHTGAGGEHIVGGEHTGGEHIVGGHAVPTIIRTRPPDRTLAAPKDAAAIAKILADRYVPAPTFSHSPATAESPSMFPVTRERFGRDAEVRPFDEKELDVTYAHSPRPVDVRIPTPAVPGNITPIPTPEALAEHDRPLTEEEAEQLSIWIFRSGYSKPGNTHGDNHHLKQLC
ncbi:hypothetical protein GNI_115680 [Gregarina niphandrodes]|uniref:Uncharacterized protein n=1 Tax=Gregarina niphandrodes TaxID=110365 RepID=A0A023B2W7_GRENI|nr:hypothetical protein GNI_115680 [Gregarina niphandrodes]EZG55240.1 hypothetical protein GNI_115680 [Gregarina niphandrodes]|eukprot:XP_011131691.1 hypothetical protein GNI_115680 [Gregarina niphandrodes]